MINVLKKGDVVSNRVQFSNIIVFLLDYFFSLVNGVCKVGNDCICLPQWNGILCNQGNYNFM